MIYESMTNGICRHRRSGERSPVFTKILCLLILTVFCCTASPAADTCKYLGNDQRTGYVDAQLPQDLNISWVFHERHAPRHAWKDPTREVQHIDFDYSSQLCVTDGLVIFGSSADHTLRALDLTTGKQQWKLHLGAPIRFAPEPGDGCIYVAGDDGFVRCLATRTGRELWRFRTGPRDTHCMGNDQLISRWPCRSGVLLAGDKLYCTGGMWSRDGVYIYCLDAGSGTIIWKNNTSGFHYSVLPHSEGYNGVSPQGNLVLYKGMLYVPAGRAEPAFYDATTGELLHCETGVGYKAHYPGGSWVMAFGGRVWFKRRQNHQHDQAVRDEVMDPIPGFGSGIIGWNFKTGLPEIALTDKNLAVVKDDAMILSGAGPVIRLSYAKINEVNKEYNKDGKSLKVDPNVKSPGKQYDFLGNFMSQARKKTSKVTPMMMSPLPYKEWEAEIGRVFTMMIAGDKVLAGGRGTVHMLDLETGEKVAQQTVEGEVRNLAVADKRIVLSTTAGRIYCLGDSGPRQTPRLPQPTAAVSQEAEKLAKQILDESGIREGYCFLPGAGSQTELMLALIKHSQLNVYGMEPEQKNIDAARERLAEAGVLGVRGQVIKRNGSRLPLNPYIADLVVCTDRWPQGREQVRELFRITRPCGGLAYCVTDDPTTLAATISDAAPGYEVKRGEAGLILKRGPIEGAGNWTHMRGNIGRTASSGDERATLPLSMLWWGGPGPARIVSRHVYAPIPLVANGKIYIQGEHDLIAVNAYNGRELWNRQLRDIGRWPIFLRGGNIAADQECVYVVKDRSCQRIHGDSGHTLTTYSMPHLKRNDVENPEKATWEYLGVTKGLVIGSLGMGVNSGMGHAGDRMPIESFAVCVFDKQSGNLLWSKVLDRFASHPAIVSDGDKLYLLDRTAEGTYRGFIRSGSKDRGVSILRAFDLTDGKEVWQTLLDSGRNALMVQNNTVVALPKHGDVFPNTAGVSVYNATNGEQLWEQGDWRDKGKTGRFAYRRHSFIVDGLLYIPPRVYELKTGKEVYPFTSPISGEDQLFPMYQNFCGSVAASKHLLLYRNASVGMQEIKRNSGAFYLPEVRPGCEVNVIPAGGIVLAPEGSSTCTCSYSYKTSLALFSEDKQEDWAMFLTDSKIQVDNSKPPARKAKKKDAGAPQGAEPTEMLIKHLRLNINAPGDKTDADANVWFGYPQKWRDNSKRKAFQSLPVTGWGATDGYHLNADAHAVASTDKPWLYTSGAIGPLDLVIRARNEETDRFKVILHFAEMANASTRVFGFDVNGQTIHGLNIFKEAGATKTALTQVLDNVKLSNGAIRIRLLPEEGLPPMLCAVEIVRVE